MEDQQFENLARLIATKTSRRQMLKVLAGAATHHVPVQRLATTASVMPAIYAQIPIVRDIRRAYRMEYAASTTPLATAEALRTSVAPGRRASQT